MADISKDDLRKEITAILKAADLTSMSAKKVRLQIESKLDIDLTERKKEVDELVMECLQQKTEGKNKKDKKAKKAASEESEDGEEEEEAGSEEEEEEEEEEKKPAKRAAPAKKSPAKRKKASSDEEESGSDEDASDEEYKPKKAKPSPKKGKGKKGGKKKGGESDSDSDWGKSKKPAGPKKGGAKKGGGYTSPVTLSPELAAIVGADQMARHEVVKKVWGIIKERNLYDPKNKQFAICDEELLKVIGVKRFRTFGMMKYLKSHFIKD